MSADACGIYEKGFFSFITLAPLRFSFKKGDGNEFRVALLWDISLVRQC